MSNKVTQHLTIEGLVTVFRKGLQALTGVFEEVRLPWKEPDAYDEWDNVAQALYYATVGSAVENAEFESPIRPLVPYDLVVRSYSETSFIGEPGSEGHSAFIRFETDLEPFDTCVFASIDLNGTVSNEYRKKFSEVKFVLVPRGLDGVLRPVRAAILCT